MKIARFTVNLFGENTYIVWDDVSHDAAIVDPGMSNDKERQMVDKYIADNQLKLTHMLFTHLHIDHAFGAEYIAEKYGLEPECSYDEKVMGANIPVQARAFHLKTDTKPVCVTKELHDGDRINVGNEYLQVIQIPGHSPGGLVYYCPESSFVLTGDVLFQNGIGRTDLAGGDLNKLRTGIKEKLFTLPYDTLVCPGHGDTTTIGEEVASNPFI